MVSVDWLLGLSPNMEPDAKVIREFALLRGTEGLVNSFIVQMTTAVIQVARESQPAAEDLERVVADVDVDAEAAASRGLPRRRSSKTCRAARR